MENLINNLSYILASKLPRREAIKLALLGVAATAFPFFSPRRAYAATGCLPCGLLSTYTVECNPLCCRTGTTCCSVAGSFDCECCNGCEICTRSGCRDAELCNPLNQKCCPKRDGGHFCCALHECCGTESCEGPTEEIAGTVSVSRAAAAVQVTIEVTSTIGIGTISVHKAVNASVDIPPFEPGTNGPVLVTATKIDPKKSSSVQLRVCPPDDCGCDQCCTIVDPVLTTLQIGNEEKRTRESFTDIPAAEHFVTIQNGHPGLRKFHVLVNGQKAAYLRIGPKEVQTIDIAAALTRSQNTITLVGQGRPGASALVLISDVPGPGAKGVVNPSRYQPLVQWEPGTTDEGVNLHWGEGGTDVM